MSLTPEEAGWVARFLGPEKVVAGGTVVRFECVECSHLFKTVTEDCLPNQNNEIETCPRCGTSDIPWLVWK